MAAQDKDKPDAPPVDNSTLPPQEQANFADRLQAKWLRHMEWLLDNHLITSTDLATLSRVLMKNGWQFDMARLPKNLQDKLTSHVDFGADDEEDIVPINRKAAAR